MSDADFRRQRAKKKKSKAGESEIPRGWTHLTNDDINWQIPLRVLLLS